MVQGVDGSSKDVGGGNEADVRQLMCRHQHLAREQGFEGFIAWALDAIGLTREWVEGLFDEPGAPILSMVLTKAH